MVDIAKLKKKINISYARYLKLKRADRFTAPHELSLAEKHSARVDRLKKFTLRMVILLTLLIIVWPLANKDWGGKKITFQNEQEVEKARENNLPVMLKPNFYGNDDSGQPFNISADSGVSVSEDKVVLNNINADMSLKDNSKINLVSTHGDYSGKKKQLVLNDGVVINTDNGYEFKTNSAYVKLNENTATGSEKVKINGRIGEIDANGFVIRNDGEEILLFGGVNLNTQVDQKEFDKLKEIGNEKETSAN